MQQLTDWIVQHDREFLTALGRHVSMSVLSLAIAFLIGLALAAAVVGRPKIAFVVINVASGLRTFPSLAVLALTVPVMGIGVVPAIIALTVLALPAILLNGYVGLRDADPDAVDAAVALGMRWHQVMRKVRLPLAAPAIFAGGQTATIQVISGATLAPFIGAGGLGDYIVTGIGTLDVPTLLIGAIPIAILALGAELLLSSLERKYFAREHLP
ncbi:ABC transporter permease [Neorhizobium sp. Rsf11]|uniref:ABC transporter permease n=2 Tax=Neorhizobium TaxID=1525371 RepID=A0ABV0MBX5_9HYPH|nr:ABC transporter permease [Neorhizobium petrolearium]MCC2613738.1 ABC transporter permease [Neorhizobium petrolearium]WGI72050.1 ABC transporter permease [Neorhizobium petrolearium]